METKDRKWLSWIFKTKPKATITFNEESEESISLSMYHIRKFIKETSFDFHEWINEEPIALHTCHLKPSLYNRFIEEYPDYKTNKWFTNKRFSQWLIMYGKYKSYIVIEGKSIDGRWITFI